MRRAFFGLILLFAVSHGSIATAGQASDELLTLVPADAGITLVVSDFRDRSREVLGSDLLAKLRALPAVRAWEGSAKAKTLRAAREEIESALGVSPATLRDDLLGDAVVLALQLAPNRPPEEASGLFLTRVRNRKALGRLIDSVNASETAEGTLAKLESLPAEGESPVVWHRSFKPGTKPDEWYTILGTDTFAWSNSESMLRGAIARRDLDAGTEAKPGFRAVREALPDKPIVEVYLDPKFLSRIAEAEAEITGVPVDPTILQLLSAMEYTGAALIWRDGPVVHLHQTFIPEQIPEALRGVWPTTGRAGQVLRRVPLSALVVASWQWNVAAIYDALIARIPEDERQKAENVLTMMRGMLLGKDLRRDILNFVGIQSFAFLDAPDEDGSLSAAWNIELHGNPDVAKAIDNALQTLLAMTALDPDRKGGPLRVETTDRDGLRVTTLAGADRRWSFAATPHRLVFGTDPEIVRRTVASGEKFPQKLQMSRIDLMHRAFMPKADGFLAADLEGLHRAVSTHRDALSRRLATGRGGSEADARRDLDRALELLEPFGGAFLSWTFSPDTHSAHQVFGLIGRAEPETP